jgi:hypothetical protein
VRSLLALTAAALVPAALGGPAPARAATLDAAISPDGGGARLGIVLRPDPARGGEAAGGPLAVELSPEVLLGRDAAAAGCPAEQVRADEAACPPGSSVGAGALELATPRGARTVSVGVFAAPGGAALQLLAAGDGGREVVTADVGPGRSRLTIPWQGLVAAGGGGGVVAFTLRVDGPSAWVTTSGCPGAWTVRAVLSTEAAQDQVACTAGGGGGAGPCAAAPEGVTCIEGNGRRTRGGAETGKVSHAGWPAITGILAFADHEGRTIEGTALNDELLGGHGGDTLRGGAGSDVLWGDALRRGNNHVQHDRLDGGDGDDFLYGSHGRNVLSGGAGRDTLWAYFAHGTNRVTGGPGNDVIWERSGRGTIDCGPGRDLVHARRRTPWRLRGCERVDFYDGRRGPR